MDIGAKTIEEYELAINSAATVFKWPSRDI